MKPDIIQAVIQDAAAERRALKDQVQSLAQEIEDLEVKANKGLGPLVEVLVEAEAELRAHERYQEHVSKQEYDKEHRRLQKAVDAAKAKRQKYIDKFHADAKPIQDRLQKARTEEAKMEAEWRVHARHAKVAGLDVEALDA